MPRIGVGLGLGLRRASAVGGFDADAQAFFDRVTTAGGTLTTTEKNATNQLVLDMKSAGIWTAMKAVYPMVGASAAACAQNLVSSSFTGTFTSGWTFASTGVTGNGTSAYMDTGFVPSTNQTINNCSASVYVRTSVISSGSRSDFGSADTPSALPLILTETYAPNTRAIYCWDYNTGYTNNTSTDASGMWGMSRLSSANWVSFQRNLSVNQTSTTGYATLPIKSIYLGASNYTGAVGFSDREIAFFHAGDSLTNTQFNNFYTAVQTFNQTLNRQVGAQIVSDSDAQAYIDRVYTAGGTLTNTEANAVNQLVIDMKAAGIWTAMKAVYPMVGSSAAACAQNLKSSSFTGTFSSGWTFSSTGVTPNGTSAYMDTGLVPSSVLAQNSASVGVYSRTNNTALTNRIEIGSSNGTVDFQESIRWDGSLGNLSRLNNGYVVGTSGYVPTKTSGFFATSRTASTTTKKYEDGVLKETTADTSASPNSVSVYLGARNNSGVGTFYDAKQYAFASIGDGLNDTQTDDFYTCVQTFNTSLSRQV